MTFADPGCAACSHSWADHRIYNGGAVCQADGCACVEGAAERVDMEDEIERLKTQLAEEKRLRHRAVAIACNRREKVLKHIAISRAYQKQTKNLRDHISELESSLEDSDILLGDEWKDTIEIAQTLKLNEMQTIRAHSSRLVADNRILANRIAVLEKQLEAETANNPCPDCTPEHLCPEHYRETKSTGPHQKA